MARSTQEIRETYPLPVYNYRVTVQEDGEATSVSFAEVSGLAIAYEPVVYKDGLSFALGLNIIHGMEQEVRLTLRKGVVKGNDYLLRWLLESNEEPFSGSGKRDVVIDLCDEAGTAVVRWQVLGALPIKLEAPAFNADTNEVAIEALELIAHKLKVDHNPG